MENKGNLRKHDLSDIVSEKRGYYFEAYSELYVQESMLKDNIRTMAYKRAIDLNKNLFKDKIVLDIGCGLGILSMFVISAGAKIVIGIDCSDAAYFAELIAKRNNFENLHIIRSKVEEVDTLPFNIEKVDIIVSEWMGICLFHESMLTTVLYARDRWLKDDGLIFPDKVRLFLAGIENSAKRMTKMDRWENVYGFNLSHMTELVYEEPSTEIIDEKQVVTDFALLTEMDLHKASSDFSFTRTYLLTASRDDYIGGFVAYFDAIFTQCHKPIILSTSPFTEPTHWRHTVFYLRDVMKIEKNEMIEGTFHLDRYEHNFRDLQFKISVNLSGRYSEYHFTSDFVLR